MAFTSTRNLTRVEAETSVCDHGSCPSPASVRVELPEGTELVFCDHHHHDVADALPEGSKVAALVYS
jgi:hypothetical protein